jgi:hypothetical protein
MYLGRADMLSPPVVSGFVQEGDVGRERKYGSNS